MRKRGKLNKLFDIQKKKMILFYTVPRLEHELGVRVDMGRSG